MPCLSRARFREKTYRPRGNSPTCFQYALDSEEVDEAFDKREPVSCSAHLVTDASSYFPPTGPASPAFQALC